MFDQPAGRLIADFGAPAQSDNPGHQHAGIFSYEVSTPEGRLIVDRGTSTYVEGPERAALRGTGAHNTIRVDGTDQFELWKSFRIGRRAAVHGLDARSDDGYSYVTAWHDGYRSTGVRHSRGIVSLRIGGWLVIDRLAGSGWHAVESFIRLAPEIRPVISGDTVELQPTQWSIALIAMPDVAVLADLYSTRIGARIPSTTLAGRQYAELPLEWVYWITPHPPSAVSWSVGRDGLLALSTAAGQQDVRLHVIVSY